MKLQHKTCHGARVHKVYDRAMTLHQRLPASGILSEPSTQQLARTYATLNPVRLRSRIEQTLTRLWELADSPNSKFPCPAIHGNILNDATISVR